MEECARAGIKVHVAGVYMGLHHTNAGSTAIAGTNDEIYAGAKMDQWRALAAKHGTTLGNRHRVCSVALRREQGCPWHEVCEGSRDQRQGGSGVGKCPGGDLGRGTGSGSDHRRRGGAEMKPLKR